MGVDKMGTYGRGSFIAAIYNYFEVSGVPNGCISSKISCGA